MSKQTPNNDIRRRALAFIKEKGMTQADFAHRLGKKSGSAWASQFFRGEFNRQSTLDAVERLIASKEPVPAARMTSFPAEPPPASPVDEWTTTAIAEKLRTTAAALGIGDRSLFSLAADRLDELHGRISAIRTLTGGA